MAVTAGTPDPDEDLAPILRSIGTGMLATTRAKLANTPETRAFLDIGLDLLKADLLEHTGPNFDQNDRSRLFEPISRDRLLKRAEELDANGSKLLSVNMFRHRWDRKDRYTEDLISYLFRLGPQRRHLDEMMSECERLIREVSLGELIRRLAAVELSTMLSDPYVSLQAIVQAALPNHQRVREFCRAQIDQLMPRWAAIYEKIGATYGMQTRPGVTWLDMALLFNAVIEGQLVWARVTQLPLLSNGEDVLAGAIFAMVPSMTTCPAGAWDDLYAVNL